MFEDLGLCAHSVVRNYDLGFRIQGSGYRVSFPWDRVKSPGARIWLQGSGFRVKAPGLRI
jgi:hypothetical protein